MTAALALRWGNLPVPYTVLWSGEVEGRMPSVRMERWAGMRVPMMCEGVDAPSGKPLFKIIHGERRRRVVREQLCQMCVKPLPAEVVCFSTQAWDKPEYRGRPVIRDGQPMCPACALLAFGACPGLQAREQAGALRIWRVPRGAWEPMLVVMGVRDLREGGDPRINDLVMRYGGKIYTGPDLHLTRFSRLSLLDLAGMVGVNLDDPPEAYCRDLWFGGRQ